MLLTLALLSTLAAGSPRAALTLPSCAAGLSDFENAQVVSLRPDGRAVVQMLWSSGGSMGAYQSLTLLLDPKTCDYVGSVWSSITLSTSGSVSFVAKGKTITPDDIETLLHEMKFSRADEKNAADDLLFGVQGWRPGPLVKQRSSVVELPGATAGELDEMGCQAPLGGRCECPCMRGLRAAEKISGGFSRKVGGFKIVTYSDEARWMYRQFFTGIEDTGPTRRHLWLRILLGPEAKQIGDALWFTTSSVDSLETGLSSLDLRTGAIESFALKMPGLRCDEEDDPTADPLRVKRFDARGVWVTDGAKKPSLIPWAAVRSPAACVEGELP